MKSAAIINPKAAKLNEHQTNLRVFGLPSIEQTKVYWTFSKKFPNSFDIAN